MNSKDFIEYWSNELSKLKHETMDKWIVKCGITEENAKDYILLSKEGVLDTVYLVSRDNHMFVIGEFKTRFEDNKFYFEGYVKNEIRS